MAFVGALIAYLGRFAGKLVNTVFGWATSTLFGQLPDSRSQTILSVIALASVVWLAALLGVLWPDFGAFMLAFVTLPESVEENWIRIAMLGIVALVPALVGMLSVFMFPADRRPQGPNWVKSVVKGYPYTVGLALTLVVMFIFVPVLKLINLARGWTDEHIPVHIRPNSYDAVLQDVKFALERAGYPTVATEPPALVRLPHKLLNLFTRGSFAGVTAEKLCVLKSDKVEVLLHSSDLVLSCAKAIKPHARSTLARDLAFTDANLTWTAEARKLEDRLLELWRQQKEDEQHPATLDDATEELKAVRRDIQNVDVEADEWEILYRLSLQVESALLRARVLSEQGAPAHKVEQAVREPDGRLDAAA